MPGLFRGIARTAVIAGTATAVSNRVSRRQAGRWARHDAEEAAAYQAQAQPEAPADPDPAPGGGGEDELAQLERLADLKDRGVLSEAEFAEQKKRILGM
jgi:putative oligomerization/nucleic acid binding protein